MHRFGQFLDEWSGWLPFLLFFAMAAFELAVREDDGSSSSSGRIGTNVGLYLIAALVTFALPLSIVGAAEWAGRRGIGVFNLVSVPALGVFAVAIMARSFAAYWLHRASHRMPILWRFHRIHHADTQVDVSLGLRHHPLELIPAILLFAGLAAVLGLPLWAAVLVEMVMMLATYWEHLALRLPAWVRDRLEPWIVLPETHLLHHSADRRQTDSNYSTLTIIWDRLFGTFRPSSETVGRIGLGDIDDRVSDSLWQQLLLPLRPTSRGPIVIR